MADNDILKATLPNEMAYLPIAMAIAREMAKKIGFDAPAISEIEVSVEEAVSNIMTHAYDVEENRAFDLVCERLPNGMKIVLREKGIPFDPNLVPRFQPGQDLAEASTAGIGTFLMSSLMDACEFRNLGPGGKETHLLKLLRGAPAEWPAVPEAAQEPAVIAEKIAYEVRAMQDHEAIQVSRCAYKSHGYSFFDDHIYYPERLVELNHNGDMVSAVAVTAQGEFMGHAALLFQYPEDRIAELTFVFINVEYRGQGAGGRLTEYLFNVPTTRPLDGIYAYAVANHPFTQKITVRYGIHDCGLLLATSPASWKFKGIPGDPNQRISVVLSFKYPTPPKPVTIFAPPHHAEFIAKLYRNLDAEPEIVTAELPALPAEPSTIHTGANESEGCAEIFIERWGANARQEVRKLLRGYCLKGMAAINLFLPLEQAATSALAAELESLGFFFAGILPRSRFGDALILQHLNNVDLDYSKITAYSDMAKEILAYVQARDPNAWG
jgi:anti-sigma regulatory factor (Ser/Thr protein kinase)